MYQTLEITPTPLFLLKKVCLFSLSKWSFSGITKNIVYSTGVVKITRQSRLRHSLRLIHSPEYLCESLHPLYERRYIHTRAQANVPLALSSCHSSRLSDISHFTPLPLSYFVYRNSDIQKNQSLKQFFAAFQTVLDKIRKKLLNSFKWIKTCHGWQFENHWLKEYIFHLDFT